MTKEQASEIRKAVKNAGNFTVYFNSKKGEFRVTTCSYVDGCDIEEANRRENSNTSRVLSALKDSGLNHRYRKESKRFQGFLTYTYIIFG